MAASNMVSLWMLAVCQLAPAASGREGARPLTAQSLSATAIRLDIENGTLAEIVAVINAQAPGSVMLPPEPGDHGAAQAARPASAPPRFTLKGPKANSFWEAIDRVCQATGRWPGIAVFRDPSAPVRPGPDAPPAPDPMVVLVPATRDAGFSCSDGPFRVVASRISYGRDIRFTSAQFPPPADVESTQDRPGDQTFFSAEIIVMAEPRLKIEHLGDLTIHEAIDDRDQSLLVGSGHQPLKDRQSLIAPDAAVVTVPVTLNYPGEPGTKIKRLRGSVPLEVSARRAPREASAAVVSFEYANIPMP